MALAQGDSGVVPGAQGLLLQGVRGVFLYVPSHKGFLSFVVRHFSAVSGE